MAMSKEELKQMLDSTIIANGQKGITAESLNNALTAIIEAMGTGSSAGSGAGSEYIDLTLVNPENSDELTPEAMAHNVEVYNKLINALSTLGPVPAVSLIDAGFCVFAKSIIMEGETIVLILDHALSDMMNVEVPAVDCTTGEELPLFVIGSFNVLFTIGLNQDGSVMIETPGLM